MNDEHGKKKRQVSRSVRNVKNQVGSRFFSRAGGEGGKSSSKQHKGEGRTTVAERKRGPNRTLYNLMTKESKFLPDITPAMSAGGRETGTLNRGEACKEEEACHQPINLVACHKE